MLIYYGGPKDRCALIAQLDRVTGYEPVGRGFESLSAHQKKAKSRDLAFFQLYSPYGERYYCAVISGVAG